MERDVNPVVAEAQYPRDSTGRAGLEVHTHVWKVGFSFSGCSPFCLRPQHVSSYIKCSCHCHIMQLQGVSPTPPRASEKAVLALHGNLETEVFLGSNSKVAFGKQIIHGTLKVQQFLPTWNTEFHKMWLCYESKTAVKYTQFKQLHKALKSEKNNKAVQILTSVLETKHILTSAKFKIYSNLKLPSEILGWGALFF